eukprot:EG_transcript_3272
MTFLVPWAYRRHRKFYASVLLQSSSAASAASENAGSRSKNIITIRAASAEELSTVVNVVNEAFMANAFFKKEGYRDRTSIDKAKSWVNGDHIYLVAVDEHRVILGAIAVEWDNTTAVGEVGQLSVQADQRQRGIGKLLVKAAEDWVKQRAGDRPFTVQMPLLSVRPDLFPYYQKQGYSAGERIPYPNKEALDGSRDVELIMYRKQFAPTVSAKAAPAPVPWLRVLSVGLVLFVNHFSLMLVIPFTPFMVADYFPHLSRDQLGLKVGYLASTFFLGQFLGAYLWGAAADRFGRRPVMLFGMLGTLLSMVLFGLSNTFWLALVARFLGGFLNGNTGVCKVYLSEILDYGNAASGFAVIGMQAALGRLLGPSIGGLLSNPCRKFAALSGFSMLQQFPYILPCLLASLVGVVGIAVAYVNLPETFKILPKENAQEGGPHQEEEPAPRSLKTPAVIISLLMYMGLSFAHIGFEQLFPLWLLKDKHQGGFNFDESMIGAVIAMTGPVQLVTQAVAVPALARKVSYRKAWQIVIVAFGIAVALTPLASLATRFQSPWAWWVAAVGAYMAVNVPAEAAYTYTSILVNDSVEKVDRGKVNGIGQSLASATRMVGPVLWSVLFARTATCWQVSFYLIFLVLIGSARLATHLPRHVGASK